MSPLRHLPKVLGSCSARTEHINPCAGHLSCCLPHGRIPFTLSSNESRKMHNVRGESWDRGSGDSEPVLEGIHTRARFTFPGFGSGAVLGIGPVGS
jgi:hypothetical protein